MKQQDRFEAGTNPCDRCKWYDLRADEFPCSECTHNNALQRDIETGME